MDENENNEQQNMQDDILRDDLKNGADKVKQKKQEAENNFGNQAIQQGAKQVRGAIKNAAQKKLAPVVKKITGKIVKFLSPLLTCVIIILVAIGLISFILNMPGLMRGKIEEVFQSIILEVKGENSKLDPKSITKDKRVELLNYISSDLGFDVIGFGFVPIARYETESSETGEDSTGKQKITDYDTELGWAYFEEGEECTDHDLLYYYLMANERSYIQNDDGLFGFFRNNKWTGMLNVYDENFVSDTDIEVKREEKLLEIRNNNPHWGEVLNEDVFTFSLDGWTGRYGKPLEFTLALHLATMSSGMTKELITNENLQTQVYIALHKADCDINFRFVREDGSEVSVPFKSENGNDWELTEKIRNGDVINSKTDVSICSLVNAYNRLDTKYILDEDTISGNAGGLEGISRHMETIEAILGDRYFAVKVKDDYTFHQLRVVEPCYLPVYGCKEFDTNYIDAVNYLNGNYNQACGSFICTYNDDGTPNTASGMLNKSTAYNSRTEDGIVDSVYDTKYKYTGMDEYSYHYELMYYDHLNANDQEQSLGAEILVPRTDVASETAEEQQSEFSVGYTGLQVNRMKGLGGIYNRLKAGEHFTMADVIALGKSQESLEAMFNEIDWFLGTTSIEWMQLYHYPWDEFKDTITSKGPNNIQLNDYYYYTNLYNNVYQELINNDLEQAEADFIELMDYLNDDYNQLVTYSQTAVTVEEQLNAELAKIFGPNFTYDALIKLVETFYVII